MKLSTISRYGLIAALVWSSPAWAEDEAAKNELRKSILEYIVVTGKKVFGPRIPESDPANDPINEKTIEESIQNKQKRPAVRESYHIKHQAFLQPSEIMPGSFEIVQDRTTGIPVANGNPETVLKNFRKNIQNLIDKHGRSFFIGMNFVLAGYDFLDEQKVKEQYERILTKLLRIPPVEYEIVDTLFSKNKKQSVRVNYTVQVISIPRDKLDGFTKRSAQILTERFLDIFPRKKKDYVPPTRGEVTAGLINGAAQQPFMAVYAFNKLPSREAWTMVVTHCALVALYKTFTKTMRNYFRRAGDSYFFSFGKQILSGLPFYINANVSGNISAILDYIEENGAKAAAVKFGQESVRFATSLAVWAGMTASSLSHFIINTNIVGGWENKQPGSVSRKARTFTKYVMLPYSTLSTVVIYQMADMKGALLPYVGNYTGMNYGHLFMTTMILAGVYVYGDGFGLYGKRKNQYGHTEKRVMLDTLFQGYQKMESLLSKISLNAKKYLKPTLNQLPYNPMAPLQNWLEDRIENRARQFQVHRCLAAGM